MKSDRVMLRIVVRPLPWSAHTGNTLGVLFMMDGPGELARDCQADNPSAHATKQLIVEPFSAPNPPCASHAA